MTTKFIDKFLKDTFKGVEDLEDRSFISTIYWYTIDSKERTRKKLSDFLKEQLENPHPDLEKTALEMRKGTKNFDEVIINILRYVNKRITYVPDIKNENFKKVEFWADAYTTWLVKKDDCDGQNALIYILARLAGIPDFCLYCVIGDTSLGGHFWTIYFSPKTGKWHTIDSTFYPDLNSMKLRSLFKIDKKRYTSVWYLFNETDTFKPI